MHINILSTASGINSNKLSNLELIQKPTEISSTPKVIEGLYNCQAKETQGHHLYLPAFSGNTNKERVKQLPKVHTDSQNLQVAKLFQSVTNSKEVKGQPQIA